MLLEMVVGIAAMLVLASALVAWGLLLTWLHESGRGGLMVAVMFAPLLLVGAPIVGAVVLKAVGEIYGVGAR